MIETYFFMVFVWVLFFLSIKLLKDFTSTVICSLLIIVIGAYGLLGGFGFSGLINAVSIAHLGLGLYWVFKSSLQLNKEWENTFIENIQSWRLRKMLNKK